MSIKIKKHKYVKFNTNFSVQFNILTLFLVIAYYSENTFDIQVTK